jgi:Protein of unknown function (DUF732)
MLARRFTTRALAAMIAASGLSVAMTFGMASANATPEDDQFLEIVKQLDVPVSSPEDAVQIGHEICDAVAAGQVEPARTVRGVISRLMAQGLDKGTATHLVWGAVGVYCPRYNSIVGR